MKAFNLWTQKNITLTEWFIVPFRHYEDLKKVKLNAIKPKYFSIFSMIQFEVKLWKCVNLTAVKTKNVKIIAHAAAERKDFT